MNPVELSLFANRLNAICDEMGAVLQRAAFSPNIRDRLDYSCAVFDAEGELCAQAAHIPVHLGSMAYAMREIVRRIEWMDGDVVVVNDPFLGGTHLPDVTLITPVFHNAQLCGFVVNRAHHADIGAQTPGSMPISSRLEEEGIIIPPRHLLRGGQWQQALMQEILAATRNPEIGQGDFAAQVSANQTGARRLAGMIAGMGSQVYRQAIDELNAYGERLARSALSEISPGEYQFEDFMDDDGLGHTDVPIRLLLRIHPDGVVADFSATAGQVKGNINCPLSVAAAAVYYVFRCLMPTQTPACAGSFRFIQLLVPEGCLLNARRPAAVAAGNVETSTRVVDVVMGALAQAIPQRIPAASHGSMNNLALGGTVGNRHWDYYETLGGGMGAGPSYDGLSAVQTHMTNTRNTPIEVLESSYPIRVREYALRTGSAGKGRHTGGEGICREMEFLAPTTLTLLTERRRRAPWGLQGGAAAQTGQNLLNGRALPGKISCQTKIGDVLRIETAGGGGWGVIP